MNLKDICVRLLSRWTRKPPNCAAPTQVPVQLNLELLGNRDMLAALVDLGIDTATAIEVSDTGVAALIGHQTLPDATSVGVYQTRSVTTGELLTSRTLAQGGLAGAFDQPTMLVGGTAVGFETGVGAGSIGSADTTIALSWNLLTGEATNLGFIVGPGIGTGTAATHMNASRWVGTSGDSGFSVFGNLNGSGITALPGPTNVVRSAESISANNTIVESFSSLSPRQNQIRVVLPDNQTVITLVDDLQNSLTNPSSGLFHGHVSPNSSYVVANALAYNPATESEEFVAIRFSGPNWSNAEIARNADGSIRWGRAYDVEDSGMVTIAGPEGLFTWKLGQTPQKVETNGLLVTIDHNAGNPTVEMGGATFILVKSGDRAYLAIEGTFSPPVVNPTASYLATRNNQSLTVNASQFAANTVVTISGFRNVVINGVANNVVFLIDGTSQGDTVIVNASGTLTVKANLLAGNDVFVSTSRTANLEVKTGSGRDIVIALNAQKPKIDVDALDFVFANDPLAQVLDASGRRRRNVFGLWI